MKKIFYALALITLVSIAGCKKDHVGAVELPEGFIENDWDATIKAAKDNDRPIYIHFYQSNCKRCAEFKEKTLNDAEVETYIQGNYIGASINTDEGKGKELVEEYDIKGHPASAVVSKDGTLKASKLGNLDKSSLLTWLKEQK